MLIDRRIAPLVILINSFPGLRTTESCCGHGKERWIVCFDAEAGRRGKTSLEFLAWATADYRQGGHNVQLDIHAPAPMLNGPGKCLYYTLTGSRTTCPIRFARWLYEIKEKYYLVG